jgi:hypothetical protein
MSFGGKIDNYDESPDIHHQDMFFDRGWEDGICQRPGILSSLECSSFDFRMAMYGTIISLINKSQKANEIPIPVQDTAREDLKYRYRSLYRSS